MKFFKKIKKPLSITLTTIGSLFTLGGIGMLAAGCNWTYTITYSANKQQNIPEFIVKYGIGATNYGTLLEVDDYSKTDPIRIAFEKLGKANGYNDWKDKTINSIDQSIEYLEQSKKTNTQPGYAKWADAEIELISDIKDNVNIAYNLMVSGAVVFPIFVLVLSFGITALVVNKKSNNTNTKTEEQEAVK